MRGCAKGLGGGAFVAAVVALAGAALGQNVATLQWQVSADDGASWNGGQVSVPLSQTSVKVRYFASWVHPEAYAFAGVVFDAVADGVNAGGNDRIVDAAKPTTFGSNQQTLTVQRFGSLLKVDDSRDTSPPGFGQRGVFPGQFAERFAEGRFTRGQAVSIFEYTLLLDGTPGERVLRSTFIGSSGSGCYSMRAYTDADGRQTMFSGPFDFCTGGRLLTPSTSIFVVPTPGAVGAAAWVGVWALRRRVRQRC